MAIDHATPALPELPFVIGHRGAAAYAPENTLAGLREAEARGVSWVEVDVHLTRDGVPVLMHDPTLDRTTDGAGPVSEATYEAISALDAGTWFDPRFGGEPVPTLAAAIRAAADLGLGMNIELKPAAGLADALAHAVLACLEFSWRHSTVPPILSSFDRDVLAALHRRGPSYPLGYLTKSLGRGWREEASGLGCRSVHVRHGNLNADRAAAVKLAGFALLAYTVNAPRRAAKLAEWGVDAVFSDTPDTVLTLDDK